MRRLRKEKHWYARVIGNVGMTKREDCNSFMLNIGAVTLTSNDGKRCFILDTYSTDYNIEDGRLHFESKLEIDKDTFPVTPDCDYRLLLVDLIDCNAEFFCEPDCESTGKYIQDDSTFEVVFYFKKSELTIPLDLETIWLDLECPVCNSDDTRPDYDNPDSMTNCEKCGSEWVTDCGDITLDARDYFSDEENKDLNRNPKQI